MKLFEVSGKRRNSNGFGELLEICKRIEQLLRIICYRKNYTITTYE